MSSPDKVHVVTLRVEHVMQIFKQVLERFKLDERRLENELWLLDHALVTLETFDERLNNIETWKATKEDLERLRELQREIELFQ
jgi:hypothetical protein